MDPLTNQPMMVPPSGPRGRRLGPHRRAPAACTRRPPTRSCSAPTAWPSRSRTTSRAASTEVGINCIRAFPGRGIRIWGARTLSSDPEWRYLNVRRLFNFISESIIEGTQWAVFEPNDERLWMRLRISTRELPHARLARRRALRRDARARRSSSSATPRPTRPSHRGGPGRRRDRHRAGQAGRVRRLPHQPVHRRAPPRSRRRPARSPRQRGGLDAVRKEAAPRQLIFRLNIGGQGGGRDVPRVLRARLGDRGHRAEVGRRAGPAGQCARSPGATKWSNITLKRGVDENLELWKWREHGGQGGPDKRARRRQIELIDYAGQPDRDARSSCRAGPSSTPARRSTRTGNEVAVEEIQICHEGLRAGRSGTRDGHADRVRLHAARAASSTPTARSTARGHAPRDGARRDRAAARPGRAPERGVPVGAAAGARRDAARRRSPTIDAGR